MKLFRALLCLAGLCSLQALDTTDPIETITSIVMQVVKASSGSITRERITRSTSSDSIPFPTYLQCQNTAAAARCDSGLQQEVFSIATECGQDDIANSVRYSCATNAEGLYCANGVEFLTQYTTEQRNCYQNFPNSCSSICLDAILSIRDQLGCCAGFLTSTFRSHNNILDGSLWDVCGVSPGELCDIPSFPTQFPPGNIRRCSSEVARLRIQTHQCTYPNSQEVIDAYMNTSNCSSLASVTLQACGVHEDGGFCALRTDVSSFISVLNDCFSTLSTSSCSLSCKTSLIFFRNDFGCCLNNIFNGTLQRIHPDSSVGAFLPFVSYDLWSKCDVDPPNVCDSPPVTLTPTTYSSIATPTPTITTVVASETTSSIAPPSVMTSVVLATATSMSIPQPSLTPTDTTSSPSHSMSPTPVTPPPTTSPTMPVVELSSGTNNIKALSSTVIFASIFFVFAIQ